MNQDPTNFGYYNKIVVNSSAGKDSQAMLDYVVELAGPQHRNKIIVAHADLGRVEWKGTAELAEQQAKYYGVQFIKVKRPQGDLIEHVQQRGMWPSPKQRYCTSDHKRTQIAKVFTKFDYMNILNCMGMRAEESPARSKMVPFEVNKRATNSKRTVHNWLPIHGWTTAQVWDRIRKSGVPHHPAYDYGMPRLSCCFCIYAPRAALLLAGKHNPELLAEYVRVEEQIQHKFRENQTLKEIQEALARGEEPQRIQSWTM